MFSQNILISSAGSRVSLLQAFKQELHQISPDSKVYASDYCSSISAACRESEDYFNVPNLSNDSFIPCLISECSARNITLIVPTIDTELELFARNRQLFSDAGITVVVSDLDLIQIFGDKRKTHEFFLSNGIAVAQSYTRDNYAFPLFVKPYDGSGSQGTCVIHNEEEFAPYLKSDNRYMILEYLDPSIYTEFTCDLYFGKDHKLKCAVPRKRLRVRDGETNKGLTARNFLEGYLKDKLSNLKGAVGVLTIQLFVHNVTQDVVGIEVNPRFGGGYPLAYKAGANYPKWLLQEFLLGDVIQEQFECWESDLLMLRYDAEIWVHGYSDQC